MSKATVLADAGAIVGLIRTRDQWHSWASGIASGLAAPYLTCEPVITEVCFVLRDYPTGQQEVLRLIEDGVLILDFSVAENLESIRQLMEKYEDLPMSLADACLVRMTEIVENPYVFTTDSDFRVFRRNGSKPIPLIIPDSL